ncbi:endo-1,3-alpha-glucanase family glycosylhydrolase [Leifsonia sp. Leaf264]|uniref:endo-1,3-alpha-glucanase family glycosylhydrolase n=1 Tax=Leifsonia sp. Leaf264 TaxID=1736314 RepID=UPI0006F8C565|nr:endo-1,3-alpha-glucanase family glycosylhydrolase [Leifsonia sp. Leaf264]KQO98418.1 hypothetical protein ASF30_10175 [Leifsonia sp. Leaf264]
MAAGSYISFTNGADRAYLKFDTRTIGNGKVVAASLDLLGRTTQATQPGVQVFPVPATWSAKTLTDSNRPADPAAALNTELVKTIPGARVTVPLTDLTKFTNTDTAFVLRYSQPYVGTTVTSTAADPIRLKLTVETPAPVVVPPTPAPAPTIGTLPFAPAGAIDTSKKVFAHYFPPYPVSLDNQAPAADYYTRNYLNPAGKSGKHAAYGGLLRDRPLGRTPVAGNYQLADLTTEVKQATDAGLDGFTVDVLSFSGRNWDITKGLLEAAKTQPSFTIVPNLDMNSSSGKSDLGTVAAKLDELFDSPSSYTLADGRKVLSTFKAEGQTVDWWTQLEAKLDTEYHHKVALIAVLLDASTTNMTKFAPISYGLGDWGTRNLDGVIARSDRAAVAHQLGVKWMPGIGVQDIRPNQSVYAESVGTATLRENWRRAIIEKADLVQLATWNDYSENTSFAPSMNHGTAFLDINAYQMLQFKTGAGPSIGQERVYVTHRVQPYAAQPTGGQTKLTAPTLGGSKTQPVDIVEVQTYLNTASAVTVTVGNTVHTYTAPAGATIKTFPLVAGTVKAVAVHGYTTITAASPYMVTAQPVIQDLSYRAVTGTPVVDIAAEAKDKTAAEAAAKAAAEKAAAEKAAAEAKAAADAAAKAAAEKKAADAKAAADAAAKKAAAEKAAADAAAKKAAAEKAAADAAAKKSAAEKSAAITAAATATKNGAAAYSKYGTTATPATVTTWKAANTKLTATVKTGTTAQIAAATKTLNDQTALLNKSGAAIAAAKTAVANAPKTVKAHPKATTAQKTAVTRAVSALNVGVSRKYAPEQLTPLQKALATAVAKLTR